ncbi:MAG: RagB/SusD family nutrient uptake outer membrane protein [Bacteroidales bacterium]|nr:RagB/SusD family nutrient uptake outer membrane protein [Bacteroidales bacterium]MBN2818277.1 RagB/SusD family nutrient uptake outer membrane protein [Bacteroidales bacterium]
MKRFYIYTIIGVTLLMLFAGCEDILVEQPRSLYTPESFKTEKGVQAGLTALYARQRQYIHNGYYYNAGITGTDEATYGQSADNNFKVMDYSGAAVLDPTNCPANGLWGNAFIAINTASGVIENGVEVGITDSLLAEAYFFRGFNYFSLVQTFGGVPLDLGAGELKFNTSSARTSVRNTVPEVYTRGIFPDLEKAVADLPEYQRVTGSVTKTVARLFLAKAYLTYAWWLENPNNIPTYPEASRVDPAGHDAQYYFQQAYNVATEAIDNPGPYYLQETFYDVNVGSNDRNMEILFYADHTESSEYYNDQGDMSYSSGEMHHNFAVWMMTWNYTLIRSLNESGEQISSVVREAVQELGRPWTRMAPPINVFTNTFADKTNDSRYDGTFQTVYRGNWNKEDGNTYNSLINANGMEVFPGDAILTFLDEDPATPIEYPAMAGDNGVGAGTLPGRSDWVISPSGISRIVYPGLWKLGTYRTDNAGGLGSPNGGITRPFNIAKFSELYFIAAEAAVKGATTSSGKTARELINVIRARAGKWKYDNGENAEKIEDHSAEMTAATPATIDIDYILLERSREFFAEGGRWFDLVRTQKWTEYASSYQICGDSYGQHTAVTVERTIEPYHYLRPIPQSQIDGMEMTEDEKAAYQNPGYE